MKLIIVGVIFIGVLYGVYLYWYGTIIMPVCQIKATAKHVGNIVGAYIQANNGHFPPSEDELVQQRFLKKVESTNGYKYYYRPYAVSPDFRDQKHWTVLHLFESFRLRYDVKVQNIKRVHGKLYDKSTNEQLLLISGPYKKHLENIYEAISLGWYKLMLQERKPVNEQQATDNCGE